MTAKIEIPDGTPSSWAQLLLRHRTGADIVLIERGPVEDGELGAEEREEFRAEVGRHKPESAARWLQGYLADVECIYAFQLLSGTEEAGGWDAVHAVQWEIWTTRGGILQADGEGFSNEDGHHILWQFSDDVTGPWNMAVLDATNRWVPFEMDLGDPAIAAPSSQARFPKGCAGFRVLVTGR